MCRSPRVRDIAITICLAGCTASTAPSAGTPDGGTSDSGACVTIGSADFDQSCQGDSDCFAISTTADVGVCPNGPLCMCPFAAINVRDRGMYDARSKAAQSIIDDALNRGVPFMCGCPRFGAPRCIASRCEMCGGLAPNAACPDGG